MRTMIDKKVVEIVHRRANGYCEVCGRVAESSMALHHRKLKSRGGQDTVSNLVWIHHGCHNLNTDSIHLNPEKSQQLGHMVGSWQEPEEAPFVLPDGTHALLLNNGSLLRLGERNGTDNS
jgi:HNH endonuclease